MRLLLLWLGLGFHLAASRPITVLAAASLGEAFTDLAKAFEAQPSRGPVRLATGASSQLRLQIQQGAPGEVFASADQPQMDVLLREGRIKRFQALCANRLALLARSEGPVKAWQDLAKPGIRLVMTPPTVPIGAYTEVLLDRLAKEPTAPAAYATLARRNVASRELHVRQLRAKVALGEADAAIVYATDAQNPKSSLRLIPLPETLQPDIRCTITALNPAGEAFVAFALSPEGQATLRRFGFR